MNSLRNVNSLASECKYFCMLYNILKKLSLLLPVYNALAAPFNSITDKSILKYNT